MLKLYIPLLVHQENIFYFRFNEIFFQVIGFPPILGESYRSHVSLFEPNLVTAVSTDMTLFKHLKSVWKFQDNTDEDSVADQEKTCLLDFAVSFKFRCNFKPF